MKHIFMEYSLVGDALSAIGILLTTFSVLMAMLGIFFGKMISNILDETKEQYKQTLRLKEETEELTESSKSIIEAAQGNVSKLSYDLRGEELNRTLRHLFNVPEDVDNFRSVLGTYYHDFNGNHYSKIVKILKKNEE